MTRSVDSFPEFQSGSSVYRDAGKRAPVVLENGEENSLPTLNQVLPLKKHKTSTDHSLVSPTTIKVSLAASALANSKLSISADKRERFFRDCVHSSPEVKTPYAERKGVWSYDEIAADCSKILGKYKNPPCASKNAVDFLKTLYAGFNGSLTHFSHYFHTSEAYFLAHFPLMFQDSQMADSLKGSFEELLEALRQGREKIKSNYKEFEEIVLALFKMRVDREKPECKWLSFPSIQGSESLILIKGVEKNSLPGEDQSFQKDSQCLEQFYWDYLHMLHINDLYLYRFIEAIERAFEILEHK